MHQPTGGGLSGLLPSARYSRALFRVGVISPEMTWILEYNSPLTLAVSVLMENSERLKVYQGFSEISRKWTTTLDAKAAFLSAMNGALLGFLWAASKLPAEPGLVHWLAMGATLLCTCSLIAALLVVLPRISLKAIFSNYKVHQPDHQAFSFYGYVAAKYSVGAFNYFKEEMDRVTETDFLTEALEQHFTISHVALKKTMWVARSGWALVFSVAITLVALVAKECV